MTRRRSSRASPWPASSESCDSSEISPKVFHNLHEEVTSTAARGHGLMLRVQQLEAEFPSIEKAFLVQTSPSQFAYNDGVDWHANLRMDQNLLTQGDMPRFVLDSYEECRGPPRLFMLDKFDVAGAGACLKRYSDPSSFKVEFTSSGMMEEEVQWENKPRKVRKKAPRWKNGETTSPFLSPLINPNVQADNSDHVSAKVPAKRVKLKSRNLLDSDITNRKGYMEHLLEVHSPEQVWPENSIDYPQEFIKSIDSGGLIPEAHEIVIDTMVDSPIERAQYSTATRKEVSYFLADELDKHEVKSTETSESTIEKRILIVPGKTESFEHYMSDGPEKTSPMLIDVDPQKPFADGGLSIGRPFTHDKFEYSYHEAEKNTKVPLEVDQDKYLASFKFSPDGDDSEHRSDDISTDLENYVDALNSMESEAETDRESKAKSEKVLSNVETHRIDSGVHKKGDFPALPSASAAVGELTASSKGNSIVKHPPETVISDDLSDIKQPLDVSGFYVPASQDNFVEGSPDKMLDELQGSNKKCELSIRLLPNGTCNAKESDIASINSIVREGSSGNVNMYPEENEESQSVSLSDDRPRYVRGSRLVWRPSGRKMEELLGLANEPNNTSGGSTPLSEMGDLSLGRKDILQASDPAECGQEQISEEDTIDMSDHLSEAKHKKDFEDISAIHMGESTCNLTVDPEEHQVKSGEEVEGCLDERASPNISGSSSEIESAIVHHKVLASGVSNNEVRNTYETLEDFDNTFPHIDDVGLIEPIMKSRVLSDDLLPFSDSPGSPFTGEVEPLFSEDMVDILGETISEEVPSGHVEDALVSNVKLGVLEDPMEHDNKVCSAETMSLSDSAFSLEKDQFTLQSDVFPMEVRNIDEGVGDNSAEGMEGSRSSSPNIIPCELEYPDAEEPQEFHEVNSPEPTMSPRKEVFLDNMQIQLNSRADDAGKINTPIPNTNLLELELSSMEEEPQESPDEDAPDHLLLADSNAMVSANMQLQNEGSGLTVNSDAGEPKESYDTTLMESLPSDVANEILVNNMQLPNESGLVVTSEDNDPTGCPAADSLEHFSVDSNNGNSPDDVQLQNGELNHLVLDSVGLSGGSAAANLHKESVQLEKHRECMESDDSSDEYVIVGADDSNRSMCSEYSGKAPGLDVQMQENYLPQDAILDRQDMEVRESSDVNNLISSLQNESIFTAAASSSDLPVLCSSTPSDAILLDSLSRMILSDPDVENNHLVSSSEDGDFDPQDGNCPSSHLLEDGNKPISVSSHQDSEHLGSLDSQLQIICTTDMNLTQTISKDNADKPSIPEPHVIVSNGETNELDTSLSMVGLHEKVQDEDSVASRGSSESLIAPSVSTISAAAPVACSAQDVTEAGPHEASTARYSQFISEVSPQEATVTSTSTDLFEVSLRKSAITSSSHTITDNSLQETAESRPGEPTSSSRSQDIVEMLPLPPLPPVEWTVGKIRFDSLTSNGGDNQLPTMTSPFMKQISIDDPQGPQVTVVEMVQPETSFASLPPGEHETFYHGSLPSEEEIAVTSRFPELPPTTDKGRHHTSLISEKEVRSTSNPHSAISHQGDGKYSIDQDAAVPEVGVMVTPHPQLSQGEGQHGQHRRLELGHLLPSLELESSQYEALSVARDSTLPGHPFFIGSSSAEEWKHQYGYEVYGGDSVQHLKSSASVTARMANLPPYGFLYPMGPNPSTIYDFMIPTMEGEKPKWTARSIRDRPRDPLIEAVAAHDKSTLRKVSELDRPSARPKADERDPLLEQIRNKAFNLRPANSLKPNIRGVPQTNLKVAAILEKANAIRQACAGSDEDDDDGDNWSDT